MKLFCVFKIILKLYYKFLLNLKLKILFIYNVKFIVKKKKENGTNHFNSSFFHNSYHSFFIYHAYTTYNL